MGFWAKIVAGVLVPLFDLLFTRVFRLVQEYLRSQQVKKEIEKKNQRNREAQEKATNEGERDKALENISNNF